METKIIINLKELKLLKEDNVNDWIKFGAKLKQMLYFMFAPSGVTFAKFYLKGDSKDVELFLGALTSEKKYMDAFLKHGLNDPSVLRSRYALERSVGRFELETGIKWPLK
jgi:hypothetical protein